MRKAWTILIYANGNNELLPEIWQSKIMAEHAKRHQDVNVILQISREKDELVSIIRPSYSFTPSKVKWLGTRRYLIADGKSNLLKDLGKINMAHPISLYHFVKWAISSYPAENYMLILSGHGYQFVGAMTDYSQQAPCIMGIPEMCSAIQRSCEELTAKIDLLVFDICYLNSIEVMYELGKEEDPAVKNVITYLQNGPIAGLALNELINTVQINCRIDPRFLINWLTRITRDKGYTLVAVAVDHRKLSHIKELYKKLAACCLEANYTIKLSELLYSSSPSCPCHSLVAEIEANLASLIISHSQNCDANTILLFVANGPTTNRDKLALYSKLAFAQNNLWTDLLVADKDYRPSQLTYINNLQPTLLTLDEVLTYISIMNPACTIDQKQTILKNLIHYKKWEQFRQSTTRQ